MFEQYCAPILHLAGVFVSVLETEKEGHARELIDEIEPTTDAIVVAGGDGTLSEVMPHMSPVSEIVRNVSQITTILKPSLWPFRRSPV